jgi:hypothetical protein
MALPGLGGSYAVPPRRGKHGNVRAGCLRSFGVFRCLAALGNLGNLRLQTERGKPVKTDRQYALFPLGAKIKI